MFSVNVLTYFQLLFMGFLRSSSVVSFIYSFLVPLQRLNNELEAYRTGKRYQLSINAQVMNLQRLLNDTFNADGLFDNMFITEEQIFYDKVYIGNSGTQDAEIYLSNLWINTYDYVIGDVCCYESKNYICINDSTGFLPSNTNYWEVMQDEVPHIGNNVSYVLNYSFIINIEQSFFSNLGQNEINRLKALINKYKIFGTKYYLNTYNI